jgi:3'-phosphoadenosine 5'-phosphosulfate sulfotransferase (PAPS reductase)/FAD synthetase
VNDNRTSEERAASILWQGLNRHHPSYVFLLLSGGNDSLTTTHFAAKEMARRYRIPFRVLHINTGIGIPETREHVYKVCKLYKWDLLEIRAKEDCGQDYEQLVIEQGFPGPAHHTKMFNRLKERCLEKLARDHQGGRILLVSGLRKLESGRRMRLKSTAIQQMGRRVWCAPFFEWSNEQVAEYRARHELPESPVRQKLCMSGECLCGAFARPGELKEIEFFFPAVGQRLRAIERRVRAAGFPWGWDERPPEWWDAMKRARKFGQVDAFEQERAEEIAMLCSSCQFRAERAA